jgi:hypothetical protein
MKKGGSMSIFDLRHAWEEALSKALLTRQSGSDLADSHLASAAGLPLRSEMKAGVFSSLGCYGQPVLVTGGCTPPELVLVSSGCTTQAMTTLSRC